MFEQFLTFLSRQSRGDDLHNLVTMVMNQHKLGPQGAMDWIGRLHDQLADKFLDDFKKLPTFKDKTVNQEAREYAEGLGNWVRANDQWSFEVRSILGAIKNP
jgi:hypothetical protein